MTVAELYARHRRVALDSNVLIYLLEDADERADRSQAVLDAAESGRLSVVLAAVGMAEICSGPAGRQDLARVEICAEALGSMPGLRIQPLTADVAVDAAIIRAMRRIGLADALHLASARAAGATAFVTNDRRVRGSPRLEVVYLDDLVA